MVPPAGPFLVDSAEIAGWSNPFSVAIHGVVDDATIRSLDFQNGRGTVALSSGSASSVLYDQYDFDGYRGYTAIVPTGDRWHVLYPYCKGESLRTVWHFETGSQRLRELPASGSCTGTDGASVTAGISLSTSTLNLPTLCGLEIEAVGLNPAAQDVPTGETISLKLNQPGTAVRQDPSTGDLVEHQFIPFAGVNCSACASPGWYEVHSILWNDTNRSATYGVLYLFGGAAGTFPDQGGRMLLDALFELPRGSRASVGIFNGTWKASP